LPWGQGYGVPFGLGGLVPISSPVSKVSAAPIVLDLTTEPDGGLPGSWSYVILADDGAGNKSSTIDATPTFFYRVLDGRGLFNYTRGPTIPAPSAPFTERGLVASVAGIIDGSQVELAAAFDPAPKLLDATQDEFTFEMLLGFRASEDLCSYVGGHVLAHWTQVGGWDVPIALEAVQAKGMTPVVLAAASFAALNNPQDAWLGGALAELRVNIRDGLMSVLFNGVTQVQAPVPDVGGAIPVILLRAWNRLGTVITPVPCLAGLSFQTLRDLERLGPPPQIVGEQTLVTPQISPVKTLPVARLMREGVIRRVGPRTFVFEQALTAPMFGVFRSSWNVGEKFVTIEPYVGQEDCGVVADLADIRSARGGPGR
jgi:hypothetical protein